MKASKPNKRVELTSECHFRDIADNEIQACCYYEYFRESKRMRKTCVLPTCADQKTRSTLTFVLKNAGWQKAAEKREAPPRWLSLKPKIRKQLIRLLKHVVTVSAKRGKRDGILISASKDLDRHPPLLMAELSPYEHTVDQERTLREWLEHAYLPPTRPWQYYSSRTSPVSLSTEEINKRWELPPGSPIEGNREYFFGLIRIDKSYDKTEICEELKKWLDRELPERAHGNPQFSARLLQLAAMRVRYYYKRQERQKILADLTGKAAYKSERRIADIQLSRDCTDALRFFRRLFPRERPISLPKPMQGKS